MIGVYKNFVPTITVTTAPCALALDTSMTYVIQYIGS